MPRTPATRDDTRRVSSPQNETIKQVGSGLLRRQNHCPEESPNNHNQTPPQRASRHQKDDSRRTAFLVAENDECETEEVRNMQSLQIIPVSLIYQVRKQRILRR